MSLTHGRHPSNLMLDRLSGKIVHIDFGDCFEVAMTREKFPEKIPFRLTRMLIHAMEVHWFAKKGTSGLCWPNLFNLLVNRYNTYFIRYMWPTTTKWVLTCKLDASKLQCFFFKCRGFDLSFDTRLSFQSKNCRFEVCRYSSSHFKKS